VNEDDQTAGQASRPAQARAVVPLRASRPPDRWAHRRGEPRVFALAWTLFLFAATLVTFVAAQSAAVGDRSLVRAAAQLLVLAATLGLTVLWPMARLSQWPDYRPVSGTARDLLVLLIPVQAMLWPQAMWWLARWPTSVVGALDLLLLCWGVLIGGVLACFQAARARAMRSGQAWNPGRSAGAMVIILVLVGAGASAVAIGRAGPPPSGDVVPPDFRPSWLFSPLTAVFEITRDRTWSGVTAAVAPGHILALLITGLLGLPAWLLARWIERGSRAPAGLH
jgi:hypothetical protein